MERFLYVVFYLFLVLWFGIPNGVFFWNNAMKFWGF